MALPSQSPRIAAAGRAVVRTHRRKGFRLSPLTIAGLVVAVGGAATWFLTRGGDGPAGILSPESASAGDHVLDDPFERSAAEQAQRGQPRTASLLGRGGTSPATGVGAGQPPANEPVVIPLGDRGGASSPAQAPTGSLGESLGGAPVQIETPVPTSESGALARAIGAADDRLSANDPVAAREILSAALREPGLPEHGRSQLRARVTEINQDLLFSSKVVKGDPLTESYSIASGDRLSKLPEKLGLAIDWRLIQRVNGISDPDKIQHGQKVKLVRGPFHAVVDKSDYRLDLYAGAPEDEASWTYVRSFRVGLGEDNSTPTGGFVVKRQSKLINPHWVNPRTGERFDKENPKNPIGERWIGLDGLGGDAVKTGYGIHGTIDPASIGQQKSMGCVRMLDDEVNLVYEMLVEGISRVRIVE